MAWLPLIGLSRYSPKFEIGSVIRIRNETVQALEVAPWRLPAWFSALEPTCWISTGCDPGGRLEDALRL